MKPDRRNRPLRRIFANKLASLSLLGIGLLLLVALQFRETFYFTHDDNAVGYLPQHVYNYRSLFGQGEFPFLNLHQYLGHAYYLIGSSGIFYLPAYLSTFLADKVVGNIVTTVEIDVSLHLFLALLAMYAYLRVLKLPPTTCLYGSLLYLTCPYWLCGAKDWAMLAYSAFYVPALLACLEAWLNRGGIRYLVCSLLLKIAFFYQGNPQVVFIYLAGEAIYFACRLAQEKERGVLHWIGSYVASNVATFVATLPLILPILLSMHDTAHRGGGMTLVEALSLAVEPQVWIGTFFYVFWPREVFKADSALFYLGGLILLPLLLAQLRVAGRAQKHRWLAPLLLFIAALFLSTRLNVVLHWLPPFDRMRWPFKWYLLCAFAYPAAATAVIWQLRQQRLVTPFFFHLFFLLSIGTNLLVALSPNAQVTFAPYHITPQVTATPQPHLTDGRSVCYGLKEFPSQETLADARGFNFQSLTGEYGYAGYDPLVPTKVNDAVLGLNHHAIFNAFLAPVYLARLNQWSVRYIVTLNEPRQKTELTTAGMHLITTTSTGLAIFENPEARPFAWFEEEPSRPASIQLRVNSATVQTDGHSGLLTISLIRIDGWSYRLDNAPYQAVARENRHGQIQIEVPPGVQTVEVRYLTPFIKTSALITLAGLPIVLLIWLWFERGSGNNGPSSFERKIGARLSPVLSRFIQPTAQTRTPEQTVLLLSRLKRWTLIVLAFWLLLTAIYIVRIERMPPAKKNGPVELLYI
jgi:hypothetical protein